MCPPILHHIACIGILRFILGIAGMALFGLLAQIIFKITLGRVLNLWGLSWIFRKIERLIQKCALPHPIHLKNLDYVSSAEEIKPENSKEIIKNSKRNDVTQLVAFIIPFGIGLFVVDWTPIILDMFNIKF